MQHHKVVEQALATYRDDVHLIIDEISYNAFKIFVALQIENRLS